MEEVLEGQYRAIEQVFPLCGPDADERALPAGAGGGLLQDVLPCPEGLAAIDQGQTVWKVYQAVTEVESWWGN